MVRGGYMYIVYLHDKLDGRQDIRTLCKNLDELSKLAANIDTEKYDVDGVHKEDITEENYLEFCKKTPGLEHG